MTKGGPTGLHIYTFRHCSAARLKGREAHHVSPGLLAADDLNLATGNPLFYREVSGATPLG